MTANASGVVTELDAQAARHLIDAWTDMEEAVWLQDLPAGHLLELRGMVVQLCADARTAGYLEGLQRGRKEAAHIVLDALRGEGLAPMPPSTPQEGW